MASPRPHLIDFTAWLPDRYSAVSSAVASVGFAVLWFAVFFVGLGVSVGPSDIAFWVYVVGALLLGTAYGCFTVAGALLASALIRLIDSRSKFWLPLPRALRVSATLFGCHLLSIMLLASLGMWKQSWPLFFGLAPYLWQ